MARLNEVALRRLIKGGETTTVDKRAFRDLEVLVERGSLKRVGSKRGRLYELS